MDHAQQQDALGVWGAIVDLRGGRVPALTTKKFAWKTRLRELLWFVRRHGQRQAAGGERRHLHGNASRVPRRSGFTDRAEGDLNPVCHFQWRHSGAAQWTATPTTADRGSTNWRRRASCSRRTLTVAAFCLRLGTRRTRPDGAATVSRARSVVRGGRRRTVAPSLSTERRPVFRRPVQLLQFALVHMMAHLTGRGPAVWCTSWATRTFTKRTPTRYRRTARTPTDPPHLCIFDEDHVLTTWEAFTLDALLTGYASGDSFARRWWRKSDWYLVGWPGVRPL